MSDQQLAQIIWDYMRFEEPLAPADVIIGLGYADKHIADHCASLYHANYAPLILFTGNRDAAGDYHLPRAEAEILAQRAMDLGVPEKDIIVESRAMNTGENIRLSYEALQERNISPATIILVQEPYMLRRDYLTYKAQWPGMQPKVICSAVGISMQEYADTSFETFEDMVNVMVGEIQRIQEYPALHFQIETAIPEDVLNAYHELMDRGYTTHLLQK